MTTALMPTLEIRLSRIGRELVLTFKEEAAGHLWYVGRDRLAWSWIVEQIAESERDAVVAAIDTAIARFRSTAVADAEMLGIALAGEAPLDDDDKLSLLEAARRVELSVRAVYDLQRDRAAAMGETEPHRRNP